MHTKPTVAALIAAVLLVAGCGGSPTSPEAGPPSVAGNYSGTTTFNYPTLGQSFSCSSSTAVTQSGSVVNIAPIQMSGNSTCNGLGSLPLSAGTIDDTGSLGTGSATINADGCSY